jgi:hypothetical protein
MMSELFQITDYEVTVDQLQHPGMNYGEFQQLVESELRKFAQMIMGLNSEFISPQDVGGVGGINCRFHPINGYPAIRQMTQYQPNSKTWFVWFDCRVLERAPESIKADGDATAKLELQQPTEASNTMAEAGSEDSTAAEKVLH